MCVTVVDTCRCFAQEENVSTQGGNDLGLRAHVDFVLPVFSFSSLSFPVISTIVSVYCVSEAVK